MPNKTCAIVGAGLTGLVAAYRLAEAGWKVTVFERYPAAGGLVATFEVGGESLECYYHHLFTSDREYVELARELGLDNEIEWRPSRMGIYSQGQAWDFGTPMSLARFSPLPWSAKLRFALSTLRLRMNPEYAPLETITAREWIIAHAGRKVWETIWGPLLAQKFDHAADRVAMVWLWGKVFLRGRSRSASGLGERLGYMRGGFGRLVDVLVEKIQERGAEIELACPVGRLCPVEGGIEVTSKRGLETFTHVLFTGSPPELLKVAKEFMNTAYRGQVESLESTGALCMVLELDRQFSHYYWLNIADPSFPFGGLIEHTNFIPAERYGGKKILYISKYLFADNPLWRASESELWSAYLPFLRRINPFFDESWVEKRHIFRAKYGQPVIPINYRKVIPPFSTPLPRLYHACMAQIYPEDRGQNYAVREGNRAAALLLERE